MNSALEIQSLEINYFFLFLAFPSKSVLEDPVKFKSGSICWVKISHIIDPYIIYIQPMTTIDYDYFEEELRIQYLHEQLMELITDDYWKKFEKFSNSYKIGELYVFKDDTVFYRVMIEKIWSTSPDFQIFSVDFGWRKICQSKDLIPLPPEPFILEYPARMAMRISLGMRKLTKSMIVIYLIL